MIKKDSTQRYFQDENIFFVSNVSRLAWMGPEIKGYINVNGHSLVLHYESLLHVIRRVISTLKNGGFFFMAGARQRGKLSFSHTRVW